MKYPFEAVYAYPTKSPLNVADAYAVSDKVFFICSAYSSGTVANAPAAAKGVLLSQENEYKSGAVGAVQSATSESILSSP